MLLVPALIPRGGFKIKVYDNIRDPESFVTNGLFKLFLCALNPLEAALFAYTSEGPNLDDP